MAVVNYMENVETHIDYHTHYYNNTFSKIILTIRRLFYGIVIRYKIWFIFACSIYEYYRLLLQYL